MWENCKFCHDVAWESASNHYEKGVPRLMEVSIFAAFVAGLVSFLSPCVLPLVPGYISMLSGIGVEQLKEGNAPRGGLLLSAVAFVFGFSIVFVSFGASASAVGTFGPQSKPAGALGRLADRSFRTASRRLAVED